MTTLVEVPLIGTYPKVPASPAEMNLRYNAIIENLNLLNSGKMEEDSGVPLSMLAYRPGHAYTENDWAWLDKPGGLIVQWGYIDIVGGAFSTVTLPVAFTSMVFAAVGTWDTSIYTDTKKSGILTGNFTLTTIDIGISDPDGSYTVRWIAIGK